MQVEILPASGGTSIYNNSWDITADGDALTSISKSMTVASASLWNIDNPNLYQCVVRISGGDKADSMSQTFGFRVFEARDNNNLYFNNKRVRFRSAIDWGFYAISGYYATDMMARLSVQNAKDIGHNQINFHRTIGEPLVMKYADELGLYLYEEGIISL
jgi:beta-galactosidase/beta-glucuronidase